MSDIQNKVKNIFTKFIEEKHLRKTPERYKILHQIYELKEHFTIEELFSYMKSKNYRVSRATLYNTIELLLEINLIKKHQFNGKTHFYEKAYKSRQHDHLICKKCGKIIEFCHPLIQEIQNDISELHDFQITDHELYFYGICSDCKNKK